MTRALLRRWPNMPLLPAFLDLETRRVRIMPYIRPTDASARPCVGNYSVMRGVLFAVYRIDDALWLRVGDEEYPVTADMHATLVEGAEPPGWVPAFLRRRRAVFTLVVGTTQIIELTYRRPAAQTILPAMYYDDEDEDFLLFLANVLGRPGKRDLVYRPRGHPLRPE